MPVDLGDLVPLTIDIRDSDGILANAGTVALTIGLPDGTTANPVVSNPSTGRYQADYATVQDGRHTVRWVASGSNAGAFTDVFDVRPADPGFLVSLQAMKAKLGVTTTDHDEKIREYVEAATIVVQNHVKKQIVRQSYTDVKTIRSRYSTTLSRRPVISLISVATTDGTVTWNVDNLNLDTTTGIVTVKSGPILCGHLQIVYVAGMTTPPANYTKAAAIIVEHLWQTERQQSQGSPYPGAYQDTADGMRFEAGAGYAIPNRAIELLGVKPPMVG